MRKFLVILVASLLVVAAVNPLSSHYDSLRHTNNFLFNACGGKYKGVRCNYVLGKNPDIDIGVAEDLWGGGGDFPYLSTAQTLSIVSTDANDTVVGGTGTQVVYVIGLDADWNHQEEAVAITGTTPVTTVGEYLRVNRVFGVVEGSSGGSNLGDITGTSSSSADVQFVILAGEGVARRSIFTVSNDDTGFILDSGAGVVSGPSASTFSRIFVRVDNGPWQQVFELPGFRNGDALSIIKSELPIFLPGRTDFRVQGETGTNDTTMNSVQTIITFGPE